MAKNKKKMAGAPEAPSQPEDKYEALARQIKKEWEVAWDHQRPKMENWEVRLKLYNNQKRDKSAVGDTTLFTILQTVLASLYVDKLNVEFEGREEGDEETAENLTFMAEFDYDEMGKSTLDYDWDWDTCFFGWGLVSMEEFERDTENNVFVPMPHVIDPVGFLRDPKAMSVNGDRSGKGAMRFGGHEVRMGKEDMKDHPHFFKGENSELAIPFDEISYGGTIKSPLRDAQEARDNAQNRQNQLKHAKEAGLGDNAMYDITVWYTHFQNENDSKPEKYKVWLANGRTNVMGMQKMERKRGKRVIWPLIKRDLYRTAHDWDGTSIPDLVEDKQRARAVTQNLALKAMKAEIHPMYVYDQNKIQNRNDLNFGFNKFIPANVEDGSSVQNAIAPLMKARPNLALLDFIYTSLDVSAQKATATPELQQGAVSSEARTLGELNMVASNVDTRYSLSAKLFGWSEKEFWYHWYSMYSENFAEKIDEKILRIVGAYGATWRPVKHDDIVADTAPDIQIESRILARAEQLEERTSLSTFYELAFLEPTINRRYGLRHMASLYGLSKDQVDRLLPPTIDERIAEDQNEILNKDKLVAILPEDDHNVHLEIHAKAKDTDATYAHVEAHKKALTIKKTRPDLFPADPEAADFQEGRDPLQSPGGGGLPTPAPAPAPVSPSQTSGQAGIGPREF